MGRQRFTAGRVRDFNHPSKGQTFYWDSEIRGLGIRATPTTKVYIFQARLNGKTIRIKIGAVSTWVIDSSNPKKPGARQEAQRLQSLIDKGLDPRIEKRECHEQQEAKRLEESRKDIKLSDAWSVYLAARKSRWSERHYNDHINIAHSGGEKKKLGKGKTKPAAMAALMPFKLSELTIEVIRAWATKEAAERGTQTRLAFSLLRAFVNWCEDQQDYKGLCNPAALSGRIKRETLPKQQAKHDTLQREQLKAWFSAVEQITNPAISAYLQALLLTGARREELLDLRWSNIDFKWQSLTIGDKVDGTRIIPLTPYVAKLLNRLPRLNAWVFSSPRSESGRLQEPRIAHNQALAIAGIEHLSIQGLRRSFGTLSEWLESPVGIVYQIQGHKPSATAEKHYRNRPLDLLRKWHVKIEAWILEQAGIEQSTQVDAHPTLKVIAGGRD